MSYKIENPYVKELMKTKSGREQLFSDVERHPLMQREEEKNVIVLFPDAVQQRSELARYIPMVTMNTDKIRMDVDLGIRGGLTPAVTRMQESPVFGAHGRAEREWDAQSFREKVRLFPHELVDLREIGSRDSYVSLQRLLRKKYEVVEDRLVNRMDWMRRQLVFDQAITYEVDGIVQTVNYQHPTYFRPTAGVLWSNAASADPIDDLITWIADFEEFGGMEVEEILFPHRLMQTLIKNDKFLDIMKSSYGAFPNSMEDLKNKLSRHIGGVRITESKTRIPVKMDLMAEATAGTSSIVVRDASLVEAGDKFIVADPVTDRRERFEVASVSGNTITTTANVVQTFAAGSMMRLMKFTVPADKIVILGRPIQGFDPTGYSGVLPDASLVSTWADVCSVRSYYNGDGAPGVFRKTIDHLTNGDPGFIEQVIGIRALPRLHSPGFMVCTVL